MKRIFAIVFIYITLFALPCEATSMKEYSNADFKFAIAYPSEWIAEESIADKGNNTNGTLTACFSEKGCRPGPFGKNPEIVLEIKDLSGTNAIHATPGIGNGCGIIDSGKRRWAGKQSDFRTTRCPEKNRWRYTTSIDMERRRVGMHIDYKLTCSMRTKSKDEEKSLDEYRKTLEPICMETIESSRMIK